MGRGRAVVGVAIALILLGVGLPPGYQHWVSTRTFAALDVPVSFSTGHIRTPEFGVNLTGWYQIWVDGDDQFFYTPDCRFGAFDPLLKTRSTLYSNGHEREQFDGADRFLGYFYAEKRKRYSLDIEVLTDASCLNKGHPRVLVSIPASGYERLYEQLVALSVVLVLVGLGVLAFSASALIGTLTAAEVSPSTVESAGYSRSPSRQKLRLKPRFSQLPPFGLAYTLVLAGVLIPTFLIFLYAWGYDRRPMGIEVRLLKIGAPRSPTNSQPEPVVVHVESTGLNSPPLLYLNSEPISWNELSTDLKTHLKTRAEWLVYVEADSNVTWGDAVNAMDVIRQAGAKIVLSTTEEYSPHKTARRVRHP